MRLAFLNALGMGMSSDSGEARVSGRTVEILRDGRVKKSIRLGTMRCAAYSYPGSGRLGTVVIVEGDGGRIRIASHGHSFVTERYDADATAYADAWCESPDELDEFVREVDAVLGPPGGAQDGYRVGAAPPSTAFEVELLPNSFSGRAVLTGVATGGAGFVTLSAFIGIQILVTGPGTAVDAWLIVGCVAAIVAGVLTYRAMRAPRMRLRVDGSSAILLDARGSEIARGDDVRKSAHMSKWMMSGKYGTSTGPRLDVRIGSTDISFGCLGPGAVGPESAPPDRLVGPADLARIRKTWGI